MGSAGSGSDNLDDGLEFILRTLKEPHLFGIVVVFAKPILARQILSCTVGYGFIVAAHFNIGKMLDYRIAAA